MGLIDKNKLEQFYECGTDPDDHYADMTYIRAEHIEDVPEVNAAKILRMCNEIEDVVSDIAFNSTHHHIYDCCQAIRDKLKEIGKELTGNAAD